MTSPLTTRRMSLLLASVLGLPSCSGGQSEFSPPPGKVPPAGPDANTAKPDAKAPEPATPTPATGPTDAIASALGQVPASIDAGYLLSISEDRSELTIDPRPLPQRRDVRSAGFSVKDSENGGKIISLHGGPFRHGGWVHASFRERAPQGQLAALTDAGYDIDQTRDLLVVDGEEDPSPTLFAFSADRSKPGIVGVCSQVTIIDFGPGASPAPVAVRKPVLYLYPESTTRVTVSLEVDGGLTATYPALRDGSWTVTAEPDGSLVDVATGRQHRYLFWEGTSTGFELDPRQAHLVPGSEAATFLEGACDRFALTADECGDMVTYWLPELSRNPYSVVQFVDEQTYGAYARLDVEPRPDTVIRPFMIFARSDEPVEVGAPPLPQRRREGFTVVEWGGADLDAASSGPVVVH